MSFTKTLSRDEMKNVKAGYRARTTEGCVTCVTPNGAETWFRDDIEVGRESNIDGICNSIYPAYDGNVTATMSGANC